MILTALLPPLLVVEDSAEDFTALRRVFQRTHLRHPVERCTDGDEALAYLRAATNPRPVLVLLDLNTPGTDGRTVLELIKRDPALRAIPVVVFSTSTNPRDIDECYQLGANSYLVKPLEYPLLEARIGLLIRYWLETTALPSGP